MVSMSQKKNALACAVAATLGVAGGAEATTYSATLRVFATYSGSGSSAGNISSSTATWSYDDVTGLLSQTGGTFNVRFTITPTTTLFRHSITGLVMGNGGAASASSYSCTEGNFGRGVGASLCGNYNFGANFANESSSSWGPGLAFGRTIGGDDMALGPQQNITAYNNFTTVSWVGTTLTLSNVLCNPSAPGNANGCATVGGGNSGYSWTLEVGPQQLGPRSDTAQAEPGLPTVINVLANDLALVDPVSVTVAVPPDQGGQAVVNGSPGSASGVSITYTSAIGFAGTETFTYNVQESGGFTSGSAVVTVTVVDRVPDPITFTSVADQALSTIVVSDAVTITGITAPAPVTVTGGQYSVGCTEVYTAAPGAVGNGEPVCLRQTSSALPETTTTATLNVGGVTGAFNVTTLVVIDAVDDEAMSVNGASVVVPVLSNDIGFNYPKTVGVFENPQHGSVAVSGDGTVEDPVITYTPAPGFTGSDTFSYLVQSGLRVGTALVTVQVIADADNDGVNDAVDNCLGGINPDQRDTDADGYGTWCDADFNNDDRVNFADLSAFRVKFGTTDPVADFNGDGNVNLLDLGRFKTLFGKAPGPSAFKPKP
jgi:hypothetical protein